jgi:ADP-L-glycero-D-manno-heptose 6-epimerase
MHDLSKGRILVTGGAGFIGSALIWELNRRGLRNILVADFLGRKEKWKNLVPLRFEDYLEADSLLRYLQSGTDGLGEVTTVFHFGACSATTETDAAYLVRNNYEQTKALAHYALNGGRRFLYASSAATYGAIDSEVGEDVDLGTLRPLNMYGYSKHMFDRYAEQAGLLPRITGLKFFNIFGPNEYHKCEMRSVVNKAFHQIQDVGRMSLFKSCRPDYQDGEQRRDFMYVKDAIAATLYLAEHVDGGGLFNMGSGEANTWVSLGTAIFEALGRKPDIVFVDMPEHLREKYQYFTCANMQKLRNAGFDRPMTRLQDAVREYVQEYLLPGRYLGDEAMAR